MKKTDLPVRTAAKLQSFNKDKKPSKCACKGVCSNKRCKCLKNGDRCNSKCACNSGKPCKNQDWWKVTTEKATSGQSSHSQILDDL